MPHRHGHLRTLADVKTHSARSANRITPHRAYMKITSLELEKLRLNRVRDNAAQRIADIDARCAVIEREKAALLCAMAENRAQGPAQPANPRASAERAAAARSFRY